MYVTAGGHHLLEVADHYLSAYSLLLVGAVECMFVGWAYDSFALSEEVRRHSGQALGHIWAALI